jgi:serine protease Do
MTGKFEANAMRLPVIGVVFFFLCSICFSTLRAEDEPASAREQEEIKPLVQDLAELKEVSDQIVDLAKKVGPAVVCLTFEEGGGSGSGVIVSEDGLVLTAAHVVDHFSDEVVVVFPGGNTTKGKVLGVDFDRDSAMVQITDGKTHPFVEVGQSGSLKQNDWVIALGHPGGFDPLRKPPVRLGRLLTNNDFMTTDAVVVGGDSGGPLSDLKGRVIGIHSHIGSSLSKNRHVPIDAFRDSWEGLKSGKVTGSDFKEAELKQPAFGVLLAEGRGGAVIEEVFPDSPADKGGLKKGDTVIGAEGKVVMSSMQLAQIIEDAKPGKKMRLWYQRDGRKRAARVTLPAEEKKPGKNAKRKRSLEDLIREAQKKDGSLQMSPELYERFGAIDNLRKYLREQGDNWQKMSDDFVGGLFEATTPLFESSPKITVEVLADGRPVSLGTIVTKDGRILTKNGVTGEGKLSVLHSEKTYNAKLLKSFPEWDLALLKIEATNLPAADFANQSPSPGSVVVSAGDENQPIGVGVISAPKRRMDKVNFLGVMSEPVENGMKIEDLSEDGPAGEAGFKKGDVMTHFADVAITGKIHLSALIKTREPGSEVTIRILRDGKSQSLKVTLGTREAGEQGPRRSFFSGMTSRRVSGFPFVTQHDMPIRPNLCGGPVLSLDGKCLGLNLARAGRIKTYMIPADEIQRLLAQEDE